MNKPAKQATGFTLVELAIVMTIIGLLIGGILKGQELLQNARMKAATAQIQSYAAAGHTFRDMYNFYPGDIGEPSRYLPGCAAAPCNFAGNMNNMIGSVLPGGGSIYTRTDENNNFWLHMQKAGLITGVNPDGNWVTATTPFLPESLPDFKLGGELAVSSYMYAPTALYPNGVYGTYYVVLQPQSSGAAVYYGAFAASTFGKLDTKVDDGNPFTGDLVINSAAAITTCAVVSGMTSYSPDDNGYCSYRIKSGL